MQIRSSHMARGVWEHCRLKRKKNKTEKGCSCEEYKYWLLEETSILYPLLQSTYLVRANSLHFEVVMDLVSHPRRADGKVYGAIFRVR